MSDKDDTHPVADDRVIDLTQERSNIGRQKSRRKHDKSGSGGLSDGDANGGDEPPRAAKSSKLRPAQDLMKVLKEVGYELARDLAGQPVLTLMEDTVQRSLLINTKAFGYEMRVLYMKHRKAYHDLGREDALTNSRAIDEVGETLSALAVRHPRRNYQRRAVDVGDERWIDLCREYDDWRALVITRRGWYVTEQPTKERPRDPRVTLIRDRDMTEITLPARTRRERYEAVRLFRTRYCAGVSDDDFVILWFYMLAVWRTGVPVPLLLLNGPHGAHKTMIAVMIKAITDPSVAKKRDLPRKRDEAVAVLRSARLVVLDNVSKLSEEQSNLLCQNATGITGSGRKHYTEADHFNAPLQSAVILAVVKSVIEAPDLASRTLEVNVARTGNDNVPERDLEKEEQRVCAGMVAVLADWSVNELRNRGRHFVGLGRMADFERDSRAAAYGLPDDMLAAVIGRSGVTDTEIVALFRRKQGVLQHEIAEGDPVIGALKAYAARKATVQLDSRTNKTRPLSPFELLNELKAEFQALRLPDSGFPGSAAALIRRMNSLTDDLRARGLTVHRMTDSKGGKLVELVLEGDAGKASPQALALASGSAADEPPLPAGPCPRCGGNAWWWSHERREAFLCRACEPMPAVVTELHEWPPPVRH